MHDSDRILKKVLPLAIEGKTPMATVFRQAFRMGWDAREVTEQADREPECRWTESDIAESVKSLHKDRILDGII